MTRPFLVRIDARPLTQAADRIDAWAAGQSVRLAAVDAVNAVARRADTALRRGANADISLDDAYVRSKTDLVLAVRDPRAEINVAGGLTTLGRYPREQLTQSANPRAKGDPSRGIPPGRKQAGLRVSVRRSAAATAPKWFTVRLREGRDAGSTVGVFVRFGKARKDIRHLYGPAPYALMRYQIGVQIEDIADDLQRSTDAEIAQVVRGLAE